MAHDAVLLWLRLEGLAALSVSLWLYANSQGSWLFFALLFFAPDLSLLGYLASPRVGATAYNLVHCGALPLAFTVWAFNHDGSLVPLALIWTAHISFDRLVGFGLQYSNRTGETHLGRIPRVGRLLLGLEPS